MKDEKVWKILEIEPTNDEEAIRNAYRAKLVVTNPEDDQEGFMELKEAYDRALELAAGDGNDEEENEYSEIIARVDAIYKDINKRMDVSCWKELLSDPVFTSLDEQDDVRREFLEYTMSHYKYSGDVLKLLDNAFMITHDRADLIEEFPEDYISFLCDQIENEGDYGLAEKPVIGRENGNKIINDVEVVYTGEPSEEPEFDYEIDEYISTINSFVTNYRRVDNPNMPEEARAAEVESLAESILQARKYDFFHPFEEIAVIKYLYFKEEYDKCFSILQDRIENTLMAGEEHSDFYYSHLIFMYLRYFVQDIHKDMGLEIDPAVLEKCYEAIPKTMNEVYVNDTHPAMGLYWYLKGDKRRANEYLAYSLDAVPSIALREISDQIDEERMNELPDMIKEEPDNLQYKASLGWIYARKDRLDDAFELLEDVSEDNKSEMEYFSIMGRLLLTKNNYEESLPYITEWNRMLSMQYGYEKNLDKNSLPIEDVRQLVRVPYSYYLLAVIYVNLGGLENAKTNIKLALEGAPLRDYYEYTELYNYILNTGKDYEEGLEFWNKEVEKENSYEAICRGGRQFMAYKWGDVNTVVDDYFYLREHDPMYIDSYVFAQEIFLDYDDIESFEISLQYVERAGLQDERLDINKAKYLRMKDEPAEAEELYKSMLEQYPDSADVNYEYGRFLWMMDRREEAGEQYEKGLEKNPEHTDILYYLSEYYNDYRYEVLEDKECNKKALDCSEKLIGLKYEPRSAVNHALILMAGMFYEDALEFSIKMAEDFPDDPYVFNSLGRAYMYMEDYDKAEESFKEAISLYNGTQRFISYKNLVRLYRMQQKYDEAVQAQINYMEKFELDDATLNGDLAELYDDAGKHEEALAYARRAFLKRLCDITGKDFDPDEEVNICKAVWENPDIAIESFGDLAYRLRKYATTLSYLNRMDELECVEKDMNAYLEMADIYRNVEEMTDDFRDSIMYSLYAAGYYYTFVRRDPELAIKNFEQYAKILVKDKLDERDYYDYLYETFDLLARSYLLLGDKEKAVESADRSLECLEKIYDSVEEYLGFERYTPLRACKIGGLYLIKEGREGALRYLDMIDHCKKCEHCECPECVDKMERLGFIAEIDGDYEKAIEYYEDAIKFGAYDSERISGIRECRKKLESEDQESED